MKVHIHYISKIKSQKESQNSRIQDCSYYFCMMIEGSGSRAGSGSIPLTSGSGSGRPKNTWIRNTAWYQQIPYGSAAGLRILKIVVQYELTHGMLHQSLPSNDFCSRELNTYEPLLKNNPAFSSESSEKYHLHFNRYD